jgi:hypothetical protein
MEAFPGHDSPEVEQIEDSIGVNPHGSALGWWVGLVSLWIDAACRRWILHPQGSSLTALTVLQCILNPLLLLGTLLGQQTIHGFITIRTRSTALSRGTVACIVLFVLGGRDLL